MKQLIINNLSIFLSLMLIIFGCNSSNKTSKVSENQYQITGIIKGLKDSTWIYLDRNDRTDSTRIINGGFKFLGSINEKAKLVILGTKRNIIHKFFWLENTNIYFIADSANFANAKITGSETENIDAILQASINKQQDSIFKLSRTIETISSASEKERITQKIASLEKYIEDQNMLFVEKNGASLIAVDLLAGYGSTWGKEKTQYLYNKLSEENKNSKEGKSILEYLKLSQNVSIGNKYANIVQFDTDGKKVELKELIGKPLLLEFWASWCTPCRANNPKLLKLYNKYHAKGFEILGISADETKANWLKAIKEDGLTWKNVSELNGGENTASKVYNINQYPTNFLLDKNGTIISVNISNEELEKKLNTLL